MDVAARNEVLLVGRLAAPAVQRELPSGDVLTTFRVVVDRAPTRAAQGAGGSRAQTVDTLGCVVWTAALRRGAASWCAGDVLELQGALHRRFWRAPTGPSSSYEVEVTKARRLAKAA